MGPLEIIAAVYGGFSLLALAMLGWDKRAAAREKRRIPEARLHVVEFLGGWPGAGLGMLLFRHKTRKKRYWLVTLAIALLHLGSWFALLWGGRP